MVDHVICNFLGRMHGRAYRYPCYARADSDRHAASIFSGAPFLFGGDRVFHRLSFWIYENRDVYAVGWISEEWQEKGVNGSLSTIPQVVPNCFSNNYSHVYIYFCGDDCIGIVAVFCSMNTLSC